MSRTHLRATVGVFIAVLVVVGATLVLTTGDDPNSTAVAADAVPVAESTTTTQAPVDAEEVIDEAQRAEQARADQQLLAYAAAVTQAENDEALRALAQAEREAGSGIPDGYWDRMAQCETGGDWTMVGSRYSGGLGFYNGTWDSFGGREFAARAGQATREQQIIVANRVADEVGLSGWGCLGHVGRP
jgi:hypothetical protein